MHLKKEVRPTGLEYKAQKCIFAGWGEVREQTLRALGGDFPPCPQAQPVSLLSVLEFWQGNGVLWLFLLCKGE